MLIKNALIYGQDFAPFRGALSTRGGVICAAGESLPAQPGEAVLDAHGARLLPGFVDIHLHGGMGREVSDAQPESLQAISRHLAHCGVTSFCPTTMTVSAEQLERCVRAVAQVMGRERGAVIRGVHLEGPYLSPARKGAQDARWLRAPSLEEYERLAAIAPIVLVGLAPELPGALEFAGAVRGRSRVAAAHCAAGYDEMCAGLAAGFSHATHLMCAMPPLHHRAPGAVGALLEEESVSCELICDGVHIHPAMLRLLFRLLGEERAVAVSDAVAAAGLPEGAHEINGQIFLRRNGACYMEDGVTLAGGACDLFAQFQTLLRFGIAERAALKACTINPARVIGAEKTIGSIAPGKQADLLLVSARWQLEGVLLGGVLQESAAESFHLLQPSD